MNVSVEVSKTATIGFSIRPTCDILNIYSKASKSVQHRDACTSVFAATPVSTAKLRYQDGRPTKEEWIRKVWFSSIKKNEVMLFGERMQLAMVILNEWSQTQKEHKLSLPCGYQILKRYIRLCICVWTSKQNCLGYQGGLKEEASKGEYGLWRRMCLKWIIYLN